MKSPKTKINTVNVSSKRRTLGSSLFPLRRPQNSKGMTLVEIMIVLAIMAGLIALGLPKLFKPKENLQSVSRHMRLLIKEVRQRSRLQQVTYRIVFEWKEKESSYWVEKANKQVTIDPQKEVEKEEEDKDLSEKEKAKNPNPFQPDASILKQPKKLPSHIRLVSIESAQQELVEEGKAYIHFTPEGFVEASIIQIAQKNPTSPQESTPWSLYINPLTGEVTRLEKATALKEFTK